MKKIIGMILFLSVVLAACGNETTAKKNLLETIKERKVLIVATSPDFPPYEFIDPSKPAEEQVVGADIELAKYIAKEMGVELKLEISDFPTAIASLSTKKADIIISGLGYKESRLESMEFTKTYNPTEKDADNYQGVMIPKDKLDVLKTLEDFDGLKIGAQSGSLQEGYVKSNIPGAQLEVIADLPTGILMLKSGKIDALAMASTTGGQYISANPELAMSAIRFEDSNLAEFDGTLIGVQKDELELVKTLNAIIDQLLKDGTYEKWENEFKEYATKIGA